MPLFTNLIQQFTMGSVASSCEVWNRVLCWLGAGGVNYKRVEWDLQLCWLGTISEQKRRLPRIH